MRGKIHATKHLPGNRTVAMCWKHNVALTENEAEVTCKACLKAVAFNREETAAWERRRAEFLAGAK